MNKVEEFFSPIIGQLAWGVRQKKGSAISFQMEFGSPHLHIKKAHAVKTNLPEEIKRKLVQQRVYAQGQWHFEGIYADWSIDIDGKIYKHDDLIDEEIFEYVSGQKLLSVNYKIDEKSLFFEFDAGCIIHVFPKSGIKNNEMGLWFLHIYKDNKTEGNNVTLNQDGVLMTCSDYGEPVYINL